MRNCGDVWHLAQWEKGSALTCTSNRFQSLTPSFSPGSVNCCHISYDRYITTCSSIVNSLFKSNSNCLQDTPQKKNALSNSRWDLWCYLYHEGESGLRSGLQWLADENITTLSFTDKSGTSSSSHNRRCEGVDGVMELPDLVSWYPEPSSIASCRVLRATALLSSPTNQPHSP